MVEAETVELSQEELAAKLESFDTAFVLSPDEQRRRDEARKLADPSSWHKIVAMSIKPILASYEQGEVTFLDALTALHCISIGCYPQDRLRLLGWLALYALDRQSPARSHGRRRPTYPKWVRDGAADIILWVKEQRPELPLSPTVHHPTSPVIEHAVEILTVMKWFGDEAVPQHRTLDEWRRQRVKEVSGQQE